MDYSAAKTQLRRLEKQLYALAFADSAIYLDSVTVAPPDTAEGRGEALGELSAWEYALFVTDANRELFAFLQTCPEAEAPVRREAQLLQKNLDWMTGIPADEYAAWSVLLNDAENVWHAAKANNDFASFEPYLEKIVETSRRFASYQDASRPAYDVLLDHYEDGLCMETLDRFFGTLREGVVPIIGAVAGRPLADDSFFHGSFPKEGQRALTWELLQAMGLSKAHLAVAETEHPFQLTFDRQNLRIATHFHEDDLASGIYSALHEGGHALYEAGISPDYDYTILRDELPMSLHESQSRFYENYIGRSRAFMTYLLPKLRAFYPDTFASVTEEQLYRAVNRAEPTLIRTEADELTYPLHVMVRYELEKRLLSGDLAVRDLPEAWNALYKAYLGIDVPDDTRGCLQDSHWAGGMLGYFPSYALGSAYGAQMLAVMRRTVDVDAAAASGDLSPITAWLREHIHTHGALYGPQEILRRTVGGFDPAYYIAYLKEKFLEN